MSPTRPGSRKRTAETLDHRWNQIRRNGAYPETRAEGVTGQTIQAVEKVPDAIDSVTRRDQGKTPGAHKTLESLTQKVAIPHENRKRAEKAIAVKECPSDLDTRVQEREAVSRRVSKYGIVAVTSRFASPGNTRRRWSCFGFICALARAASAND